MKEITEERVSTAPRLALVGCGAVAELFFLPAIAKKPHIMKNLVLTDINTERLKFIAKKFGIEKYTTNYHEIITVVDGVIIATPNQFHYPIAMDFLNAGVHVLCEKPLAESEKEAREMIQLAEENGAVLAVNNTRRLSPAYRKVKELVSQGTIGDLVSIQYYEGAKFSWPTESGFYFNSKGSPKGVLMDRGAHVFDLICWWLGGKPELISSENDSFGGPEAVAFVKFRYQLCVGEVRLSWLNKQQNTFRVEGTQGVISGSIYDFKSLNFTPKPGKCRRIKISTDINYFSDFGNMLVNNFIDVIVKGARPLVSGTDVIDSIEWLEESYLAVSRFNMPWYTVLEK